MNIGFYEDKFPLVKKITEKARIVSLPGLGGVPVAQVVKFFIEEIKKGYLVIQAKAIAFTFFIALFPYIIFMFTLIPYIPVEGIQSLILRTLEYFLPNDVYQLIDQTIFDIVQRKKGGLLSIGLFLSVWLSTNGMMGVMDCFDRAAGTKKRRKALKQRLVAFQLTLVIFMLLMVSLVLIVAGNWLIRFLLDELNILTTFNVIFFSTLEWMILIVLFFTSISIIYSVGPSQKQKYSMTSVGSTVATVLVIAFSIGFSSFVNNFGRFNEIYGSLGTVVAMLMFIYLNSFALLIGFELNISIKNAKEQRSEENIQQASEF